MPAVLTFEFEARMGITEESAVLLLKDWPNVDDTDDNSDACLAINNSLNDLLHGEGVSDEKARKLTGADRHELQRIYKKWATARGWKFTGVR